MIKTPTACCALCQLSGVSNRTTKRQFQRQFDKLIKERDANTEVGTSTGNGQTCVFVIVSPGEEKLEDLLIELEFTLSHEFPRRVGYKSGRLAMYIKTL